MQGDHPTLVVRHFFYDWDTEKPSSLQIERIGTEVEPKDRSVDLDVAVSRQLYALGDFVHDNLKFFLDFNAGPPVNGFMPPIDRTAIGAAAENRPVIGRFELEPDEALILEVEPPKGVYWSYSLGNQWWETIHYGRHQSSLNAHQANVDSDGVLRVVVSSRDPGVANWLDAAGHSNGAMILRCVRTETAPTPTARVVKFADIESELPAETKRVTAAGAGRDHRGASPRRARKVLRMSFSADELEDGARAATGLEDFGSPYYREGLERTVEALNTEADLNELGNVIQHATISNALIQRLRIDRHLQATSGDRRRGHRRAGIRHRAAAHRNHGFEPAGGQRSTVPVAADVGIAGVHATAGGGHPAHRSADRSRPRRESR